MGLGEVKRVNMSKYLAVLERTGYSTGALKEVLDTYELNGNVKVGRGEVGDGQILISYSIDNVHGFLRFSQDGKVYEGLMGDKEIANITLESDSWLPFVFIAGVFGEDELNSELSSETEVLIPVIIGACACYLEGAKGRCDYTSIDKTVKSVLKEKIKKYWEVAYEMLQDCKTNFHGASKVCEDVQKIIDANGHVVVVSDDLEDLKQQFELAQNVIRQILDVGVYGQVPESYARYISASMDFKRFCVLKSRQEEACDSDSTGTITMNYYDCYGVERKAVSERNCTLTEEAKERYEKKEWKEKEEECRRQGLSWTGSSCVRVHEPRLW